MPLTTDGLQTACFKLPSQENAVNNSNCDTICVAGTKLHLTRYKWRRVREEPMFFTLGIICVSGMMETWSIFKICCMSVWCVSSGGLVVCLVKKKHCSYFPRAMADAKRVPWYFGPSGSQSTSGTLWEGPRPTLRHAESLSLGGAHSDVHVKYMLPILSVHVTTNINTFPMRHVFM